MGWTRNQGWQTSHGMDHMLRPLCLLAGLVVVIWPTCAVSAPMPRPRVFSWETLPVFFHSANASGPWSAAAARQIARYGLATFEKDHAMLLPSGGRQSEEIAGPAACRQLSTLSTEVDTFFYLNSVIDWPTNFNLHSLMVENPAWRLKNRSGMDLKNPEWLYNLSVPAMQEAWIAECVSAVRQGCTGCFIDQANVAQGVPTWPVSSPVSEAYRKAHMGTMSALATALHRTDNYAIFNHLGVQGYNTTTMMIEDFACSEHCISVLQTVVQRGFTVEAHAGHWPVNNTCLHGDINAMVAFLVAAGNYSYYHCSAAPTVWSSDPAWPNAPDSWLDWRPEYDLPLGAPLGPAEQSASPRRSHASNASVWTRRFASGTHVEFDGASGVGTIWWSNGKVQRGPPTDPKTVAQGCAWESVLGAAPS